MFSKPIRFLLMLAVLPCVLFVYNACQGGFKGAKSHSTSTTSASCKAVVQDGKVINVKTIADVGPSPFAFSKIALRKDLEDTNDVSSVYSKATHNTDYGAPLTLPVGTELSVVANNDCLFEPSTHLENTVISKDLGNSGMTIPGMDEQAYAWTLSQDFTDLQLEELANAESCIVGISWNKTYKLQAFNDPKIANQAHLTSIHAIETYPSIYNSTGGLSKTGSKNVVVGVIDTGVDWTHPDLEGNMWNHSSGVGVDIPSVGTGLVNYNPFDISSIGHGTHVSGLIAAVGNNSKGGMGVMPFRAKIMGIKVFKSGSGDNITTTSQYFFNAVKFAFQNHADVINVSLDAITEGPSADTLAESAFKQAVAAGTVVAVAMGNADSGKNGAEVNGVTLTAVPAVYSTIKGVIGVGAYETSTGRKSYFSHYSTKYAEIAAPGSESGANGLYSTLPVAQGSYGRLAGTSQATPLVAGAAALTIGLIRNAYHAAPTPSEVETLLLAGSDKSNALKPYFKDGNRLNIKTLIAYLQSVYPLIKTSSSANPDIVTPNASASSECP